MPPKAVKTVRDLIFWQYAKLIAHSAGMDGQYGFIMSRYRDLKSGKLQWSSILREDIKAMNLGRQECAYCGGTSALSLDHIIPQRVQAPPECDVHQVHNLVWCCRSCNSRKGGRDVFTWFGVERRDEVPRIVEGKFLKLAYRCHECRGTLDAVDVDGSGALDVLDLGAIFAMPCPKQPSAPGAHH